MGNYHVTNIGQSRSQKSMKTYTNSALTTRFSLIWYVSKCFGVMWRTDKL